MRAQREGVRVSDVLFSAGEVLQTGGNAPPSFTRYSPYGAAACGFLRRYCVTYMEKYIMYITLLGTHLLRWLANNRSLKESIIAEKKTSIHLCYGVTECYALICMSQQCGILLFVAIDYPEGVIVTDTARAKRQVARS